MTEGVHPRAASFGDAAEAYERGRPGWSAEAIETAARRLGLAPESSVLDLAAGTGKLTRELVGRFGSVTAVEPIDGMRAVLERLVPGARALTGTAEAIPLAGASTDAVFVGEAFHWFDAERACAEVARVLRPGGGVAVLYNRAGTGDADAPWQREAQAVFEAHRLPPDDVDPFDESRWKDALTRALGPLHEDAIPVVQRIDAAGLLAAYASFSGLAGLPDDRRAAALEAIRDVLARHAVGEVEVRYTTTVVTASRGR